MTIKNLSLSVVSAAAVFAAVSTFTGCGSDEPTRSATGDSGAGGKGTGGRRATGGSTTSSGGASGASGAGGGGGAPACSVTFGTTCDGPEDCPAGQRCCGKLDPAGMPIRYISIGCAATCATADAGAMGIPGTFEICHPTDTCENSTATCLTSPYLPTSLSRCLPSSVMGMGNPPDPKLDNVKNAVNCGSKVCAADEQCCIRQPLEPYCAPKSATCSCTGPDAGTPGDGGNKTDGGNKPDSSVQPDAAPSGDASDAASKG